MKNLINELIFGKNSVTSGVLALTAVAFIALGCGCGKTFDLANLGSNSGNSSNSGSTRSTSSDDSVPSNSVVENLVKETTSDFSDAIQSGDFSDLYNNASSDFRSTYKLDDMTTAFKTYTDKKSVVGPILKKVPATSAEFTTQPSIRTEKGLKILVANGKFPTKPYSVRFDYEYVMREGEWKLLKLVINIP